MLIPWTMDGAAGVVLKRRVLGTASESESDDEEEEEDEDMADEVEER